MTSLAVGVPIVDSEAFSMASVERAVSREVPGNTARGKERIATFGTEEMLSMVSACTQSIRLAESDVVLVRNRSLAVITPRSEFLLVGQQGKRTVADQSLTS